MASSITRIPDHPIRHVSLSHIRITASGSGFVKHFEVPEEIAKYPEADMFGELPAYGLFCRHTEDLTRSEVHLITEIVDERPALVANDVSDLGLTYLREQPPSGGRHEGCMTTTR